MLDFGSMPPEINSARMYSGPGTGPMMAAAGAWDGLAVELSCTATRCGAVVAQLTETDWRGPASLSMAAAAAPYFRWLQRTATQAEQAAVAAKEAAAAYEIAFGMTVAPPVIAANRSLLMALVATNFFGQNAPAIAATDAHYAEMWVQDAAAMYGYVGSSAAARQLTPFTSPQSTIDPTLLAAASQPSTLSQVTSAVPAAQQLADLISPLTLIGTLERVPNVVNTALSFGNAATSGRGILIQNARILFQGAKDAETAAESRSRFVSAAPIRMSGSAPPTVSAGMSRAGAVGSLSVPPNWTVAAPEIRTVALPLPDNGWPATTNMPQVPGSAFSQSVLGTLSRSGCERPVPKSKPIIVRSPAAG